MPDSTEAEDFHVETSKYFIKYSMCLLLKVSCCCIHGDTPLGNSYYVQSIMLYTERYITVTPRQLLLKFLDAVSMSGHAKARSVYSI